MSYLERDFIVFLMEKNDDLNKTIKEQQEEINRLTIAYQNASDQRQHYVEKCLKLSKVVLEFASALDYNQQYLYYRHKELIQELKRNLQDNK